MVDSSTSSRITRRDKEHFLHQHARSIWMTGLSGAGKTTLGLALEKKLFHLGFFIQLLDGDHVRTGLNKDLRFSDADRTENIRRIAEVNALYNHSGIITINCFISPTHAIRQMARATIGSADFIEVFIKAPLSVCEERDVKGYYRKARQGLIKEFTGVDSPFEEPEHPDLLIDTSFSSVGQCLHKMIGFILPKITITPVSQRVSQ